MKPERIAELRHFAATSLGFALAEQLIEALNALEAVMEERDEAQADAKRHEYVSNRLQADLNAERIRWERPATRWRKMRRAVAELETENKALDPYIDQHNGTIDEVLRTIDRIAGSDIPDAELEPKPVVQPTATVERFESAAIALVEAMETCHICQGTVLVSEQATNCENCSWDCDEHDGPSCPSIYVLHDRLKVALSALPKDVKPEPKPLPIAPPPRSIGTCPQCGGRTESALAVVGASGYLCCPACKQILTFKTDTFSALTDSVKPATEAADQRPQGACSECGRLRAALETIADTTSTAGYLRDIRGGNADIARAALASKPEGGA